MNTKDYAAMLADWDFAVDGQATVRPTVGILVALESIDQNLKTVKGARDFVRSLMATAEGADAIDGLDITLLYAIAQQYGQQAGEYLRKNLGALRRTPAAA